MSQLYTFVKEGQLIAKGDQVWCNEEGGWSTAETIDYVGRVVKYNTPPVRRKISEQGKAEKPASNIDYTAALRKELSIIFSQKGRLWCELNIFELAAHLNSVVKVQQNCA